MRALAIMKQNEHQQHQQLQQQQQQQETRSSSCSSSSGLTLELTSARSGSKDSIGSVRRNELADGGTRLVVTLPSVIDGEQANLTAALLFEQIDMLPYRSHVERVKLHGLHFTSEGVMGIKGFLSAHLDTIKHVSLKDIMTGNYKNEDAEAFASLAKVFQTSKLETLNLSDNAINASLWRNWASHSQLRQLILDYVEMDDESIQELQKNFTFADSLEELYVVLTNHVGKRGLKAANNILKCCRKISSLRWAVKDAPPDAVLPWFGLAEMAQEMSSSRTGATLKHLVMDGGTISTEESGIQGLARALQHFTQMATLKLRSVGLNDSCMPGLVAALREAKSPLEQIDLSRNQIGSVGATTFSKLSGLPSISKNLAVLTLDRNGIESAGAASLLEAFGSSGCHRLDLKLDGNPFVYSKIAYNLACRKGNLERDRDELRRKLENQSIQLSCQSEMVGGKCTDDVRAYQEEVAKLREEKAALIRAFSVIGSLNQVNEHMMIMDRVNRLEASVFGHSTTNDEPYQRTNSGNSDDTSQRSEYGVRSRNSLNQLAHHFDSPLTTTCDSPAGRFAVDSVATRGSVSRRATRDIGAAQNSKNILVQDTSERWGSTAAIGKSKIPTQAQGILGVYPASNLNKGRKTAFADSEKTSHSRSLHGDRAPSGASVN